MKKTLSLLVFALILITGCSGENSPDSGQNNHRQNEVNNQDIVNDTNDHDDSNIEENDSGDHAGVNNDQSNEQSNDQSNDQSEEMTLEELLKEKTYDFFVAQREYDVGKMTSYLAETATYDEKDDTFFFDKITYPHEMERFEIADQDLDYRYTQEETDYVIVGFAAIDYEEEYSFIIDFTWILENGQWKIQDMDINK